MPLLLLTSFIWAFSFGLVKKFLGGVDASFVAFVRLFLALLLFLPLWRPGKVKRVLALRLLGIGMVQFGLMYVCYIQSFRFLAAHQVALFTVFTPLFVAAGDDLLERRWRPLHFWTALLAVAGTALIVYSGWGRADLLKGFVLVQASNACFAGGQVLYRRLPAAGRKWRDRDVFAWLFLGGAAAAALAMLFFSVTPNPPLSGSQALTLLYLGLLASGIGFFLWNIGSSRVSAGTLAVMNNLKIPLAVGVSLLVFHERADLARLAVGGSAILLALWLNSRRKANEIVSGR
ncbi:MAG: EamA family transporter [Acidobacteria bacterium]|jgi:drug/metabolite transporter (DMT)-like permease|nr:EamA family transporter [Acidobacteriota bacterium]